MHRHIYVIAIAGFVLPFWFSDPTACAQSAREFETTIRPLLHEKCAKCHGRKDPKAGLVLTTVDGIARGSKSSAVIVPGEPSQSRLIQAVRYTGRFKMPPGERLGSEEVAKLEHWVEKGAIMPGNKIVTRSPAAAGRITDQDRRWWSFQPIQLTSPPLVQADHQVRNEIDRFIIAKLESYGLQLSPPADRATLLRRVTFDLTGLPPTPDAIDSFLNDSRPGAYRRVLDRLLASPQYGERWGRHWLDIARYADTNGGGFDYVYPNAWKYRDYVVKAMNADVPFDVFITEQLAGDLLPVPRDETLYLDRLAATGFLTLAPKGLGMQDKEQMAMDVVDDQIDVLGRSLLGMTLSCARCHDHKFDPIPTSDYYGLAGIFRSTVSLTGFEQNPSYWPETPLEFPVVTDARNEYIKRKAANAKSIKSVTQSAREKVITRVRSELTRYLEAATRLYHQLPPGRLIAHWPMDHVQGTRVLATRGPEGMLDNVGADKSQIPLSVEGRIGQALRFTGQKQVVSFPADHLAAFEFDTTTDFSVSFWLRAVEGYQPQSADTLFSITYDKAMTFIAMRPGSYNGIYLRHYDGAQAVDIKPSSDQLPILTNNQWHHVVFTSDRDGAGRVFIDNRLMGEVPIAGVSSKAEYSGSRSLLIGVSNNAFQGDMDDLAIWNRVLLPIEVNQLASQSRDPSKAKNVVQIEKEKQKSEKHSGNTPYSYEEAAGQGLVTVILKNFVGLLRKAAVDKESAFHILTGDDEVTRETIDRLVSDPTESLQAILDSEKGPLRRDDIREEFFSGDDRQRLAELTEQAHEIEKTAVPPAKNAMVAYDAKDIANLRIHIAGDRHDLGEEVTRGFPQVVTLPEGSTRRIPEQQSGRLQLAAWLTHRNNPLTVRVFVNRVWQWHFGTGIVATSDNFGRQGEKPVHPELLDWLSIQFVEDGWSLKRLHRWIMLSATYQQSSAVRDDNNGGEVDSGNRMLWRMNRRRLEAEPIRDAMLAANGTLDQLMGGTVNDWKAKMFSVNDANEETANFDTHRRSIYLPVIRGAAIHEMMQLFDFGDPNSITSLRYPTTVTAQALFMMNNPFVHDQAKAFGKRLLAIHDVSDRQRIHYAYRLTVGRRATEKEMTRVLDFLKSGQRQSAWNMFCHSLFCLNEFVYIQ